jgi:hypothetical protein
MPSQEEQRRAARIKFQATDNLEVHYKFLTHLEDYQCDTIFKGVVANLSKGGALFVGPIPGPEWLTQLDSGSVLIGLNIMASDERIKALTSLRWTRPVKAIEYGLSAEQAAYELRADRPAPPEHSLQVPDRASDADRPAFPAGFLQGLTRATR